MYFSASSRKIHYIYIFAVCHIWAIVDVGSASAPTYNMVFPGQTGPTGQSKIELPPVQQTGGGGGKPRNSQSRWKNQKQSRGQSNVQPVTTPTADPPKPTQVSESLNQYGPSKMPS